MNPATLFGAPLKDPLTQYANDVLKRFRLRNIQDLKAAFRCDHDLCKQPVTSSAYSARQHRRPQSICRIEALDWMGLRRLHERR